MHAELSLNSFGWNSEWNSGPDSFDEPARRPYCHSPHLVRRWQEEQRYAEDARRSNEVLLAFTRTTYRVGDEVLLEGRTRVRITAVQPVGFITVPRKYGNLGGLLPAVTCDVEIYQYRRLEPGSATGQTSVDRLSPLPAAAR